MFIPVKFQMKLFFSLTVKHSVKLKNTPNFSQQFNFWCFIFMKVVKLRPVSVPVTGSTWWHCCLASLLGILLWWCWQIHGNDTSKLFSIVFATLSRFSGSSSLVLLGLNKIPFSLYPYFITSSFWIPKHD